MAAKVTEIKTNLLGRHTHERMQKLCRITLKPKRHDSMRCRDHFPMMSPYCQVVLVDN